MILSARQVSGLDQLATVSHKVFVDPKVMELILKIIDYRPVAQVEYSSNASTPWCRKLRTLTNFSVRQATSGHTSPVWNPHPLRADEEVYQRAHQNRPETASTLARGGLQTITSTRIYGFDPRQHGVCKHWWGRLRGTGSGCYPCTKNHPAYAVYLAQGEWIKENEDSAGLLLDENAINSSKSAVIFLSLSFFGHSSDRSAVGIRDAGRPR